MVSYICTRVELLCKGEIDRQISFRSKEPVLKR